jgi:deoxyribodipyrimidine photo-lyase
MWFRRDLRLADNPALLSAVAAAAGTAVVPLFVLDPTLWHPAGPSRRAYLAASLADLGSRVGGLQRGCPASR